MQVMTCEKQAVVGRLDDLLPDSMTMATVGDHPIALIRTSKGVVALDNACPHQGYGLTTGSLDRRSRQTNTANATAATAYSHGPPKPASPVSSLSPVTLWI